jgi:predicted MFS family arabinose efflux permease
MNHSHPLWTKDFLIISAVNFFLALVVYLLIVMMSGYATTTFDASPSQAGLVSSIFIVGVLIGRLFIGGYIEKIGYRKLLFIGLILYTLSSTLYFIQTGIPFLLLTRVIHGITLGIAITATTTIVAHIIPESRRGEGIGYFSLSTIIATAVGPFLGILLAQHTSYNFIFFGCFGLGIVSLSIALFATIPKTEQTSTPIEKESFSIKNFIEPKALPISIVMLVLGFCYSSVLTYINFYAIELDLINIASFFFITYSVAILISRPFSGRLLDTKGANYVMYPAFVLFAAGMLVLSSAHSGGILLLASILIGFGYGNMQSCCQAISIKSVPPEKIGLSTATFSISLDIGLGFGPYLLGLLITIMSYSQLYALLAIIVLCTIVLYYMIYARYQKNQNTAIA